MNAPDALNDSTDDVSDFVLGELPAGED